MKIYTHIERIKRLNALIQRESTGTPLQLAEKWTLGVGGVRYQLEQNFK